MGSRIALPLLLVAAVAASVLFWWLSNPGSTERAPADLELRDAPAVAADAAADLERADAVEGTESPVSAERTVLDRPGFAEAERDRGSSDRTVVGRVVDMLGNPIEGAQVRATDQQGIPLDMSGDAFPWMRRYEDTTDHEGIFELAGAPAGSLRVAVRAGGFAPLDKGGINVPEAKEVELEALVMSQGAILSGHVVDPSGRGVAGAELIRVDDANHDGLLVLGGRREPVAVTEADGSFRVDQLACGAWKIQVHSENHPDRTFDGLAERPGQEVGGLEFALKEGTTIAGRVTDVPGVDRGKLTVRAQKAGDGDWFDRARSRQADVDASGNFLLRGLEIGERYDLTARRRNDPSERGYWNRSRSETVRVDAGEVDVRIPYQPEGALTFQVIDAGTGEPLTDFEVDAGVGWPQPVRGEDGKRKTFHPEGVVRVGDLRLSDADERVEFVVRATGYREYRKADVAIAKGQELDLGKILLESVPVVRVTVKDAGTNAPVADALVQLQRQQADGQMTFSRTIEIDSEDGVHSEFSGGGESARTDENGVALLTSMEGATCTLSVRADGHARYELEDLFLPEGQDVEQVALLTPGGTVVVQVLDAEGNPKPGAGVRRRRPSEGGGGMMMMGGPGGGAREVADGEGKAVFENLEPGLHEFQLSDGGGGGMFFAGGGGDEDLVAVDFGAPLGGAEDAWTEATVVEGETVEITIQAPPRGSLTGRVREAGRILAGASLQLSEKKERSPDQRMMMPFGGGGERAKSDGEGLYLFEDVKEGTYTLQVEHPTRRMPQEFEVEIAAGENSFDVDLSVSVIEGRITDQDGQPLPGLTVSAERAQGEEPGFRGFAIRMEVNNDDAFVSTSNDLGGEATTTDSDGRYRLRGVLPDVELVIKAEGDEIQPTQSEPLTVAPDQVKNNVDFVAEAGGAVAVEATLPDGAPARFCLVRATYQGDEEDVEPKFTFMESGSVKLTGLRPGPWTVNVQKAGPGRVDGDEGTDQQVVVVPGETVEASVRME